MNRADMVYQAQPDDDTNIYFKFYSKQCKSEIRKFYRNVKGR